MNMIFDPNLVAPSSGGGGILPVGMQQVMATGYEMKSTAKDVNSGMLCLFLTVVSGKDEGSTGVWNLNIKHATSQKAVEIAEAELSAVCRATGYMTPFDVSKPDGILNKPFGIDVKLQKNSDQYTEVKRVLNYDMSPITPTQMGPPTDQAAADAWNAPAQQAPPVQQVAPPQQPQQQQQQQQQQQPPAQGWQQQAPQQAQPPNQDWQASTPAAGVAAVGPPVTPPWGN